jgi:type IV pilus assembly protein PilA
MKEMIARRLALKAKDKKGFTLIEVIVVLVILAILAAIAIPALTGYIEKANQRSVITEAAIYRTSLQAIGTDTIASGGTLETDPYEGTDPLPVGYMQIPSVDPNPTFADELNALIGNDRIAGDITITDITYSPRGQLTGFTYDQGEDGFVVAYDGNGYTVEPHVGNA